MSRFARIYFPGGLYHLISRFVDGKALLRTKKERQYYLRLLSDAAGRTDATIIAYCLMPTKIHLVVRAGWEPLERLMKSVNTGYAAWLNNRNATGGGAVYAGRYKSVLLEDNYIFDLVRYVHNGPVRAKKATTARQSSWSSHQAYVGDVETPDWLDTDGLLAEVNPKMGWARRQFDTFVNDANEEGVRRDLEGSKSDEMSRAYRSVLAEHLKIDGPIVGSEEFVEMVYNEVFSKKAEEKETKKTRKKPTLDKLVSTVIAELNIERKAFFAHPKQQLHALARRLIVYLWVAEYGGKQSEVAKKIGASSGAVTRWYGKAIRTLDKMEPHVLQVLSKF